MLVLTKIVVVFFLLVHFLTRLEASINISENRGGEGVLYRKFSLSDLFSYRMSSTASVTVL